MGKKRKKIKLEDLMEVFGYCTRKTKTVLYSPKSGSLALNHRKTYFGAIYLLQQLNHPKEPQKKHHLVFVYTLQCPDCLKLTRKRVQ